MISNRVYAQFAQLILLLVVFLLMADAVSAARMPSAKRECALCHIMWLTDFKREDVIPLVPYEPKPVEPSGRQDVSSTERMCLSCHDGFVLDSRFLWKGKKHAHPVGNIPSDKIIIPKADGKNMLPLNDDGKMYCGTCHSAHGVDWSTKDSPIFMRIRTRDGALCQACHKSQTKGTRHGNHPLGKELDSNLPYLKTTRAQTNTFGKTTCQSCHTPHAAGDEKLLITSNKNSEFCGNCHTKRHAIDLADAAAKRTHPVNVIPKDAKIAELLLKSGGKTGEDGELICETCHSTHAANTDNSILVASNKESQLCRACHTKQQKVANSKHDIRTSDELSQNIRNQTVAEGGDCSACHVPHEGSGPKMWARSVADEEEPMAALCLSCHTEEGMATKHQVGEFTHPVGVEIERLGQNVNLPAYTRDGVKSVNDGKGFVTCASCHDPHQWDPEHPQQVAKSDEEGDATNSFLRQTNAQDSSLCVTCHKKQETILGSKHDLSIVAPESVNANGITPGQAGTCGSCHAVHNGLGPRMWVRDQLPGSHVNAENCISCHNKDGLAKDKPIDSNHSHPVGVSIKKLGIIPTFDKWLSRFAPVPELNSIIPLPLYNKEGHAYRDGTQVGCGTCHDPHRWSAGSLEVSTEKEGDATNSFLRIAEQGNADLCINCHSDKSVVKFSRHGLKELRSPATDTDTTDSKGTCSQCHRPHQTKGAYLWAQETGTGSTTVQKLCTSCHHEDGTAKDKLTGKHSHPIGIDLAARMMPDEKLPLFNKDDGKKSHNGQLDCATCHDPHQWDPNDMHGRSGMAADVEGDASNSFLRLSASQNADLCLKCHGDKKTVLKTDHDLSITAPQSMNIRHQTAEESGVCGQCHSTHKAASEFRLWAQKTSPGQDPNEELCLSCHTENHVAGNKIPEATLHPSDILAWSEPLRAALRPEPGIALPVFAEDGRPAKTGIISCPTCHNAHQWWVDHETPAPGKNTEGDTKSSFLRLSGTEFFVCADCHGADSLFRYKYFHAPKSHAKHAFAR
ncbi:MAG: hypothetical protein OQK73_13365 [Gammaproteobacteria bacterium]|nr:hypothetical protein [Gammaproteobacteria bacterium]